MKIIILLSSSFFVYALIFSRPYYGSVISINLNCLLIPNDFFVVNFDLKSYKIDLNLIIKKLYICVEYKKVSLLLLFANTYRNGILKQLLSLVLTF